MSKAFKAAALSAFVVPGTGHFFLKHHARGFLLMGLALACGYFLIAGVSAIAHDISEGITAGRVPMDAAGIMAEVARYREEQTDSRMKIATWGLVAVWVVGVIDSFRLGLKAPKTYDSPMRPNL